MKKLLLLLFIPLLSGCGAANQLRGTIDAIVRVVSFPSCQQTNAGEREVQKSLRKQLLKYKLHKDQVLFDRAYAYIKEYY